MTNVELLSLNDEVKMNSASSLAPQSREFGQFRPNGQMGRRKTTKSWPIYLERELKIMSILLGISLSVSLSHTHTHTLFLSI